MILLLKGKRFGEYKICSFRKYAHGGLENSVSTVVALLKPAKGENIDQQLSFESQMGYKWNYDTNEHELALKKGILKLQTKYWETLWKTEVNDNSPEQLMKLLDENSKKILDIVNSKNVNGSMNRIASELIGVADELSVEFEIK